MRFLNKALVLVMAIVTTVAVAAQHDSFDEEMSSVILLQSKVVQKELGVTTAQRAAMNKYADAHRAKLKVLYSRLQANHQQNINQKDQQELRSMFNTMKRGVFAQLTAAQLKRLREISLQTLDFTALGDPIVAARVGLSASQSSKIRSVINSGIKQANVVQNNAVATATKGATTQDQANQLAESAANQVSPQVVSIRNDTKQKVMALLTAQQRSRWQGLLGRPFHG